MYCNLNRHCIARAHDAKCKGIKKARQIYLDFELLVLLNHECFKLLTISKRSQENWLGWYLAKSSGKLAWPRGHIEESVFKLLFIYFGKLFPNTMGFGTDRNERPNRMARKTFNDILSTYTFHSRN